MNLEKLKKDWEKYETAFGEEEYMDIDSHTNMAFKVPQLIAEVEKLQETVRIYKVVDEHVKEQSKKVKHLFPLENTAGYGQLCDKVLELERKIEALSEPTCRICGEKESWCSCLS